MMDEVLGKSLSTTMQGKCIKGLKLHGEDSLASHLQFVDDTLHMSIPSVKEALEI